MKCEECEFEYVQGLATDEAAHQQFHDDTISGTSLEPDSRDIVIARIDQYELLECTLSLPREYRHRFWKIALRAQRDTPAYGTAYDGGEYDAIYDGRAYALRLGDRAIGLVVARRRSPSFRMTWESFENRTRARATKCTDERWAIDRVWVLEAHRRRGLARRALGAIAKHLGVAVSDLAWVPEFTDSGKHLARSICSDELWIA